jgi:hypothetical protein
MLGISVSSAAQNQATLFTVARGEVGPRELDVDFEQLRLLPPSSWNLRC